MFRLSVCWSLLSDSTIDEDALRLALHDLSQQHAALRTEVADPPLLFDYAVEAAANLSLLRAVVDKLCGRACSHNLSSSSGRPSCELAALLAHWILSAIGRVIHVAWPRVAVRNAADVPVPLDVVDCQDLEQLAARSAWLLDGRSARHFLRTPLHAVLLRAPGNKGAEACEGGQPGTSLLHVAVNHGLCDGFSGLPLLRDLQQLYSNRKRKHGENFENPGVAKRLHAQARGAASADEHEHGARKRKADTQESADCKPKSKKAVAGLRMAERRLGEALAGTLQPDSADTGSSALFDAAH